MLSIVNRQISRHATCNDQRHPIDPKKDNSKGIQFFFIVKKMRSSLTWKLVYILSSIIAIKLQNHVHHVLGDDTSNTTATRNQTLPKEEENKDPSSTISQHSSSSSSTNNETPTETPADADADADPVKTMVQTGPFIDLLGPTLLSLEMVDETHAQIHAHATSEVLQGNTVVGLYFSADWCGPCRRFTPELVSFSQKLNQRHRRRGSGGSGASQNTLTIVWISRCRDIQAWGQYFTHMNGFYALYVCFFFQIKTLYFLGYSCHHYHHILLFYISIYTVHQRKLWDLEEMLYFKSIREQGI